MTVLLDTNIIIEHLRSGILQNTDPEIRFAVSVITIAELFRYPGLNDSEAALIDRFLEITFPISVDMTIARRAARLGRTRKTRLPDLLIAASALDAGIPLITKNAKDFRGIPKLIIRERP